MSDHLNPYQPPSVVVADIEPSLDNGNFVAEGRRLDAGRGVSWLGGGFKMVLAQPLPWILMVVVLFVMRFVVALIPFVNMLNNLMVPVFMGGIFIGAHRQAQGGAIEFGDLFAGFRDKVGQLIAVGALSMVVMIVFAVIVGIVVAVVFGASLFAAGGDARGLAGAGLGAMILLIPLAVIVGMLITACWWLAPALVVFHDLSPFDAMKRSFTATMRNWLPALVYGVLAMLATFGGMLLLFLGLLLVVPALYASMYLAYRDIFIEE
jgi:hypothetical protein